MPRSAPPPRRRRSRSPRFPARRRLPPRSPPRPPRHPFRARSPPRAFVLSSPAPPPPPPPRASAPLPDQRQLYRALRGGAGQPPASKGRSAVRDYGDPVLLGLNPPLITHLITKAETLAKWTALLDTANDMSTLSSIHVATALNRLGKLALQEIGNRRDTDLPALFPSVFERLARRTSQVVAQFDSRCLANSCYGLAISRFAEHRRMPKVVQTTFDLVQALCAQVQKTNLDQFSSSQHFAVLAYGLAIMGFQPAAEVVVRFTEHLVVRGVDDFEPQHLGNLSWACAKLNVYNPGFFDLVCASVNRRDLSTFQPQELTNTLWAMAKFEHRSPEQAAMLGNIAKHLLVTGLDKFEAQNIANFLHSLGRFDYLDDALFDVVLSASLRRGLDVFIPQDFSNILWALGKLGYSHQPFLDAVVVYVTQRGLNLFEPQHVSNFLWGLVKLDYRENLELLLDQVCSFYIAHEQADDFDSSCCSMILWCLVKFQHCPPEVIESLHARLCTPSRLAKYDNMNISNIMYSLALKEWADKPFIDLLVSAAEANLAASSFVVDNSGASASQNLAQICWALASLKIYRYTWFAKVSAICQELNLEGFSAFDISSICWSMATLDVSDYAFFQVVARYLVTHGYADFETQNLSLLVWSFASFELHYPQVYAILLQELGRRDLALFKVQEISNLLWALAMVCADSAGAAASRLALEIAKRPAKEFEAADFVIPTWAFAVMDLLDDSNVRRFLSRTDGFCAHTRFHAAQIHDVRCSYGIEHGIVNDALLPPLMQMILGNGEAWIEPFVQAQRALIKSSRTHLAIARALVSLGCQCENEVLVAGGISIDIRVTTPKGRTLYVEVDGPWHFLSDGFTLNGPNVFKRRMMLQTIVEFASIKVVDWDKLPLEMRLPLLQAMIDAVDLAAV